MCCIHVKCSMRKFTYTRSNIQIHQLWIVHMWIGLIIPPLRAPHECRCIELCLRGRPKQWMRSWAKWTRHQSHAALSSALRMEEMWCWDHADEILITIRLVSFIIGKRSISNTWQAVNIKVWKRCLSHLMASKPPSPRVSLQVCTFAPEVLIWYVLCWRGHTFVDFWKTQVFCKQKPQYYYELKYQQLLYTNSVVAYGDGQSSTEAWRCVFQAGYADESVVLVCVGGKQLKWCKE